MSALMGPPTMETWPEGVMLGIGMGFSFVPQQPIPLQLMVRNTQLVCIFNCLNDSHRRRLCLWSACHPATYR